MPGLELSAFGRDGNVFFSVKTTTSNCTQWHQRAQLRAFSEQKLHIVLLFSTCATKRTPSPSADCGLIVSPGSFALLSRHEGSSACVSGSNERVLSWHSSHCSAESQTRAARGKQETVPSPTQPWCALAKKSVILRLPATRLTGALVGAVSTARG